MEIGLGLHPIITRSFVLFRCGIDRSAAAERAIKLLFYAILIA